jgi:hypothetical protein
MGQFIFTTNSGGGGGVGNNLIPTDIVDPAAAPYVVQPGTLAQLAFSGVIREPNRNYLRSTLKSRL